MRAILTSDSQTDFHNLDLCEIAMQEVLASAKKYEVDVVIHCGDAKQQYNPLDARVVQFWVRWSRLFAKAGIRFIILKGNHDRISQTYESKDWLDILRAAGAETVTVPKVKKVGGMNLAFLPYTKDKAQEKKWAAELAESFEGSGVLFFHTEIQGAVLNAAGIETSGYRPEELMMDRYVGCFGGHIHKHQKVGENIWYVGSPFCQDWSEANQRKGHLLITVSREEVQVKQIRTKIPGWFDAEFLEANNITPEEGAYIRSRVPVTSKKLTQEIRDEEERLQKRFAGAYRFYVVPKVEQVEDQAIQLEGLPDSDKIKAYVSKTWSDDARSDVLAGVGYLTSRLSKIDPGASYGAPLRFISGRARNFLSFRELSVKYHKQGLVLLRGENRDWPSQENGAGKTNALSLLPVVLWGETLKGQKNDAWANERIEGEAFGSLKMRDARGRLVFVERTRPHGLRLVVNDEDQSTGLTGKGRDQTQGKIEEVIGYDKDMFLNAVYIDQTIANGFVFGTQSKRMDLVGKIQNLERFEDALKLVGKDIEKNAREQTELEASIGAHETTVLQLESDLEDLQRETVTDWEDRRKKIAAEVAKIMSQKGRLAENEKQNAQIQRELDEWTVTRNSEEERLVDVLAKITSTQAQKNQAAWLIKQKRCPKCGQPSVEAGKKLDIGTDQELENLTVRKKKIKRSISAVDAYIQNAEMELLTYEANMSGMQADLDAAKDLLRQAEEGAKEEQERNERIQRRRSSLQAKIRRTRRILKACRGALRDLDRYREILEYAKKAFHRSGMPLYLAASLCPVLNRAAEEYAEIFFDGKIKLRFLVDDGKFIVEAVNPVGSSDVDGQSGGESAMAGIVAAFAVREIAPKTNLLAMDEPGTGLDTEGAKAFARGLLKLKDRFSTIIITTHHPAIVGMLSGETVWTVVKEKGISRLEIGNADTKRS